MDLLRLLLRFNRINNMLNRPLILGLLSNTINIRIVRYLNRNYDRLKVLQRRSTRTTLIFKIERATRRLKILSLLKLRRMRTFRNTNSRCISLANIGYLDRYNVVVRHLSIILSIHLNMIMNGNTSRSTRNHVLRVKCLNNINRLTIFLSRSKLTIIMMTKQRIGNLLTLINSTRLLSIRVPILNTKDSNNIRYNTNPRRITLLRARLINRYMNSNHLMTLATFQLIIRGPQLMNQLSNNSNRLTQLMHLLNSIIQVNKVKYNKLTKATNYNRQRDRSTSNNHGNASSISLVRRKFPLLGYSSYAQFGPYLVRSHRLCNC